MTRVANQWCGDEEAEGTMTFQSVANMT